MRTLIEDVFILKDIRIKFNKSFQNFLKILHIIGFARVIAFAVNRRFIRAQPPMNAGQHQARDKKR